MRSKSRESRKSNHALLLERVLEAVERTNRGEFERPMIYTAEKNKVWNRDAEVYGLDGAGDGEDDGGEGAAIRLQTNARVDLVSPDGSVRTSVFVDVGDTRAEGRKLAIDIDSPDYPTNHVVKHRVLQGLGYRTSIIHFWDWRYFASEDASDKLTTYMAQRVGHMLS